MSWGNWSDVNYTEFGNNGNYKVKVAWQYRQNLESRQTQLRTSEAYYVCMKGANIGKPQASTMWAGVGFSTDVKMEKYFDNVVAQSPNYYKEGSYKFNFDKYLYYTINHGKDGNFVEKVKVYAKCDITSWVGAAVEFDWTNKDITLLLPKMNPLPPAPSGGRLDLFDVDYNFINIIYSDFYIPGGLGHYEVKINNDDWINNEKGTTYKFTNLRPETRYTVSVRAVDMYGQSSALILMEFKTLSEQETIIRKINGKFYLVKMSRKVNLDYEKIKSKWQKINGVWEKIK